MYCIVHIPPKCICTALFTFLPSPCAMYSSYSSQVHMYCIVYISPKSMCMLCIVHIPLKCMYCIVYISPKSMCYVLFIYLPSAYVLHCLNFSQVHVLCIVYIPPSPCVLHCFFSSRNIWVAFFHFSHVYVYCSVFIPASLCEITIIFFGCKLEMQLFNSFRKLF